MSKLAKTLLLDLLTAYIWHGENISFWEYVGPQAHTDSATAIEIDNELWEAGTDLQGLISSEVSAVLHYNNKEEYGDLHKLYEMVVQVMPFTDDFFHWHRNRCKYLMRASYNSDLLLPSLDTDSGLDSAIEVDDSIY